MQHNQHEFSGPPSESIENSSDLPMHSVYKHHTAQRHLRAVRKPRPAFLAQLPASIRYEPNAEASTTAESRQNDDFGSEWAHVCCFRVDLNCATNAEIKLIRPYCQKADYQRLKNRKAARVYRQEKRAQRAQIDQVSKRVSSSLQLLEVQIAQEQAKVDELLALQEENRSRIGELQEQLKRKREVKADCK